MVNDENHSPGPTSECVSPPPLVAWEWELRAGPLPTKEDFHANVDNPDGSWAWGNFGGLSLPQAFEKFLEFPIGYQEDFMFMGAAAFAYYFPVVERYLSEFRPTPRASDDCAWILAHGIEGQFSLIDPAPVQMLKPRVLGLAAYVRAHLDRFSDDPEEQHRIDDAWQGLQESLSRPAE